jgi:cardiolipin synthase
LSRKKIKSGAIYTLHNRVKLIRGGSDYFNELEKIIKQSKHSVFFQTYIFDEDNTGRRIADAMKDAVKRGVAVYMLLDGYASQALSKTFIKDIQDAGVHFRWFEPILKNKNFYFGRRMHHKVVVADYEVSLVGGVNISDRYNDLPGDPAWLDWAVKAEGEISAGLARVCVQVWKKSDLFGARIVENATPPVIHKEWNCAVRIRRNDWVRNRSQITKSYNEMFRKANSHIIIMSSYFLPGAVFQKNLSRAARRGVKVKIVVAGASDVKLAKNAERYIYRWLFRKNIEIYEYPKTVLHAKLSTYDSQWVTIGSYNVNNISAYASVELNLDVNDEEFAKQTEKKVLDIIKNECVHITEEGYRTRFNFFQKIIQRASYDIVRLLFFLFTFYYKRQ